jgi:hypothetical protein
LFTSFYQKHKKAVPFIVSIFVLLVFIDNVSAGTFIPLPIGDRAMQNEKF